MRALAIALTASLSTAVLTAAAQSLVPSRNVGEWMVRVGERVEQYYARAHSIICEETVRLEPLGYDLLSNGDHVRQLVYELRVSWDGATGANSEAGKTSAASVLRQLLTVDGRPPRPGDEPGCMDPEAGLARTSDCCSRTARATSYHLARPGPERGRSSVTLNYTPTRVQPADVVWTGTA